MLKLPHWCNEASFAHWEQDGTDWPSWEMAGENLRAAGQLAHVLHPSEEQKSGKIVAT